MKIPYFKAKELDSERIFEGFYFAMPETTYCVAEDYVRHPVKILHYLGIYTMTDWCLPNNPQIATIDPSTLELVGYVDSSDENFVPGKWVKGDNYDKTRNTKC